MKILMIGPDQHNSTDGVIVAGITNLLRQAFGEYDSDYVFLDDHSIMTAVALRGFTRYDLVIVCGTPWLWDNFQKSIKFRNLLVCFERHHKTPKIFLGAGSCVPLGMFSSNILETEGEQEGIRKLFNYNNTTVVVRDSLAKDRLDKAGVGSHQLRCPSFFCYGDLDVSTPSNRAVLIWADPTKTISAEGWTDEARLKEYCATMKAFYDEHKPQVLCALESERDLAVKIGLPRPLILKGVRHTLEIMAGVGRVLSGRVHCAIPAYVEGAKTELIPLDSRALTLTENQGYYDSAQDLNIYVQLLKSAVA